MESIILTILPINMEMIKLPSQIKQALGSFLLFDQENTGIEAGNGERHNHKHDDRLHRVEGSFAGKG